MRISSVSKLSNTPVSTIRAYEKWGMISPVERLENGYRVFEQYHVTQIKIIRLLFGEYLNKHLRKLTMQIIYASVARDRKLVIEKTMNYLEALHSKKNQAMSTIEIIKNKSTQNLLQYGKVQKTDEVMLYSVEKAAGMIGTTKGSIRNWERNGLINCQVKRYERRQYTTIDIERMKIIDLMRQIGFSMSCIKHFFVLYDEGNIEGAIKSIEGTPKKEDFITSADAWISMLTKHEERSKEILKLLEIETL